MSEIEKIFFSSAVGLSWKALAIIDAYGLFVPDPSTICMDDYA